MLLVYIPNVAETNPLEALRAVGLYELHDEGLACSGAAVVANGPDGGGGALIGWPGLKESLAMNLATQEWHALKPHVDLPGGRAWIGWEKGDRPTPESLARKKQLGGDLIRLEDEREWLVPVATQAPRRMSLDDSGHVSSVMVPRYQAFFQAAWDALESFVETDGKIACPFEESFDLAVRVLAMNYRLTRDLASALGIIGNKHLWTIPATTCELASMVDLIQKKRLPGLDSIASGDAA